MKTAVRLCTAFCAAFLVLAASLPAFAASLAITKAEWKAGDRTLFVQGTGPGDASIVLKDAASGAVLGTRESEDDGKWKFSIKQPSTVPCRVRAEAQGASAERDVANRPSNCGGGGTPVLSGLSLSGPSTLNENSTASYTATATFSDGSSQNVTASASWSENSSYASISAGTLTASEVPSDQSVTVTASYTAGGVTKTAQKSVTIVNAGIVLSGLSISGPASVNENSSASYTATATFSDGSAQNVTASASWSENSSYASISAGTLTASEVPSDQSVTVTASYTAGGVTKSATKSVTIVNAAPVLSGLSISGPGSVNENTTANYTATATFSDGSTQNVTASATWSEDSTYATIRAGVLTASEVPSAQSVIVTASYTAGGVAQSATKGVTITDGPILTGSHVGRFSSYEGTVTCLQCHTEEATAMHGSVHYQWQGDASESVGLDSAVAGKLGGINDFCIYPDINWIGKLTNLDGVQVDGGCARCHTGLGSKPLPTATQAQLENIDCLLCHSKNYKRKVDLVNGAYRFVPDTANMTVSLMQAAVDITLPDKNTCLNCHTRAGGGNNFKRGDIEEAHRNATAAFDVHLAPTSAGGAGLQCTSCHVASGHRIAGRGIDMRQRDTPAVVACSNCHGASPHGNSSLDKHTSRVNCNVCHIPEYAKIAPTDMHRDWSQPGDVNPATRLYEPHSLMAAHVTPVYGFFNGRSEFYQFGSPAVPKSNGKILMAGPLGSINDPGAKIQAMKRHEGKQPIDPATRRLFPLKIGIFFQTGDVNTAVAQGAAGVGWNYNGHEFADTERYMGIYHEVSPSNQALQCASCHENGNRLDFNALGYTPKTTRNGVPLCQSCHSPKTASFYPLHQKHVSDKNINCSECHTFSKAN